MKKFLIILLLLSLHISTVHAQGNIILRPTLTPQIIDNNSGNYSFSGIAQATENTVNHENNSQKENSSSCIQNPKMQFFMYHYIRYSSPSDSAVLKALSINPEKFHEQMQAISELKNQGKITLMNGDDFVDAMKNNCFPGDNVWIFTADDGWEDNYYQLAPIASQYQVPFIFGIISGTINSPNFINETQLKELANNPLFTIASHTITHPKLNYGALHRAQSEICDSKTQLEEIIQKPVEIMIYPYGLIGNNTVRFTKGCGYSLGFSTHYGDYFYWNRKNYYNIDRIHISEKHSGDFFRNLANK